jgi:hypothetical protein
MMTVATATSLRLAPDTTRSDSEVVAAYLAGDRRAFDMLVDRYQRRLLNFVYRTIGDRERGEDLVQEVFIRVHRHLHRFDQSKKFSTWIYTIASNLARPSAQSGRPPSCSGHRKTTAGPAAIAVQDRLAGRPVPQAASARAGGVGGSPAARASSDRVRAPGAGRQDLRGNRRDHGLQPGNREEPPEPRAPFPRSWAVRDDGLSSIR